MKITDKQLHMLMVLLQDSQMNIVGAFSYDLKTRNKLLNDIINQQSNDFVEVESNTKQEKE